MFLVDEAHNQGQSENVQRSVEKEDFQAKKFVKEMDKRFAGALGQT